MSDPYRVALIAFCAAALRGLIHVAWGWYKSKKALEPTPMKLKNGVYIPWGLAERARWWSHRFGEVFIIYVALLIGAIIVKPFG